MKPSLNPSTYRAGAGNLVAQPSVVQSVYAGLARFGSVQQLRAASPLPDEAQRMIDDAVVRVGLDRLTFVDDLISAGLTKPLPNWLAVPELYWEKVSKSGGALRTMTPKTRGENNLADRLGVRLPIYATIDDFSLGIRELLASERAGMPLDTSGIEECTRRVNEAIEDAGINGANITVDNNETPGLANAPNAATQSYSGTGHEAWDHASKTGKEIVDDVMAMAAKLRANRKFGPYNLYVNGVYGNALNKNYSDGVTTFDYTIRERIERLMYGGRGVRVREADMIGDASDQTFLVQMTSDVVDVVMGQAPTAVNWADGPGWVMNHVILACVVPRVKVDYDGKSGVCIGDVP